MRQDKNTIELASNCTDNIKSFTKKEDVLKYLPIENERFKILFENNKIIFSFCNKTSYTYLEKKYFSNLEIMKRLGIILGVELEREDIFSITRFCLNIKQVLVKGEI